MYKRENILLKEKKKRKRKGSIKRIATVTVTVIATKQNTTEGFKAKKKKVYMFGISFQLPFYFTFISAIIRFL